MSKILGISPLDKDATVSVLVDGKVVFAAGEERYSRVKQQGGFPTLALQDALKQTGFGIQDFDAVAYAFLNAEQETALIEKSQRDFHSTVSNIPIAEKINAAERAFKTGSYERLPGQESALLYAKKHKINTIQENMNKGILRTLAYKFLATSPFASRKTDQMAYKRWCDRATKQFQDTDQVLINGLRNAGWTGDIRRFAHHSTHAANAYYASGFENSLCVTFDGYGSGMAGSVCLASGTEIKQIARFGYPNSLGLFYEQVTSSLGFKPSRHEGKIVGLASYGSPMLLADILLSQISTENGDVKFAQPSNIYLSRYLASKFSKADVAAAYQYVLEKVACDIVRYWIKKTNSSHVVLSGGVVANVKLNQKIFEIEGVRQVFVYQNMGDGGCATGAALCVYYQNQAIKVKPFDNAYLGPDIGDDDAIEKYLREKHPELPFKKFPSSQMAKEVASLIHQGAVVARCVGRMEYGPRALGNRTIMYHGRDAGVNQWLNKKLGRTEFMPFAPVTLFEHREKCYSNTAGAENTAEFMTITFTCTPFMQQSCPAAVHVDNTARPQLIRREQNPGYYDIICEYEKLSGSPSVINTSFNMHEEPIVRSEQDAIRAFILGGVEYLILGNYLIERPVSE